MNLRKQIAEALEYSGEESIKRIHQRNKQLESMSVEISQFGNGVTNCALMSNQVDKPTYQTLLYNEDGVYEITF